MEKKINILLCFVVIILTIYLFQFLPKSQDLAFNAPYFVVVEDYEPQRGKKFYLYDINHPAMRNDEDGTIKTRSVFLDEIIKQNARECHFIQPDVIDLVTPDQLFKSKERNQLFRSIDGRFLSRDSIIKNFENFLVGNGKLNPQDTLVINKDSSYYSNLMNIYFDRVTKENHDLVWGELENEGTIPLDVLKFNAVMPLKVYNSIGEEVKVHQATLGFYTWKQVCGKRSFEKSYAPLMQNGILSKEAVQKIQALNQSGECVLISNIITFKDGKFVEITDRFKFVVKNTVIAV